MNKNAPTISFHTIGCRLNQYETAVLRNTFENGYYHIVPANRPADIAVINTCTVTERSDADARRFVNRLTRLNPNVRIAMVGCQAQLQKEILHELPNVCWVVGNAQKFDLAEIVRNFTTKIDVRAIGRSGTFKMPAYGVDVSHMRANLKIQDGCDNFCTYCDVPYARGRARSRDFTDILKEARALADAGHKEIVLTGINIGTYRFKTKTVVDVIKAIEDIPKVKRVRISSIEPTDILKKVIADMHGRTKLCRYLHVPVQSGHDIVLKKMGRKYMTRDFEETVRAAKKNVPDLCIGTDIIVGFPGETEDYFQVAYDFLKHLPLDYFHVFSFSRRNRAKAGDFTGQVPVAKIQQRSKRLRALGQRKRRAFYERMLGKKVSVLFEQQKRGFWHGLTDNFIHVKTFSNNDFKNRIRRVRLTRIDDETVVGEL